MYIFECLLPSPFPTYYDFFFIVQAVGTPLAINLGSGQGTAFPFCIQPHSAQVTSSPPALVPALDPPTPSGRRIKKVTNTVDRIIEVVKLNTIIITKPVIGTILRTGLNAITTLQVCLENIAALSHPIRSKTKTNRQRCAHGLPRVASASLHVITSSFDWFTALLVSFLIGYSDSFGLGFIIVESLPLLTMVLFDTQLKTPLMSNDWTLCVDIHVVCRLVGFSIPCRCLLQRGIIFFET